MIKDKIEICRKTRRIASESLRIVLQKILSSDELISEVEFRDLWLSELRKNKEIFPDGWYIPPSSGIGILFSTDENFKRTDYTTLRKEIYWPRKDSFLDLDKGITMLYASPVNRKGTIGDFGLDIYLGKNKEIINHLKKIYASIHEIFNRIEVGMKLSDIYKNASVIFVKNDLANEGWLSSSDPTGINIGHSIPFLTEDESVFLGKEDWKKSCKMISQKRKFINAIENTQISKNFVITIEPRLKNIKNPNLPTLYFHTIAVFKENGEKELLTGFDEIFKLTGMDYMLQL